MTACDLIQFCTIKKLTMASCESLTAGLFTSTLASIPGASAVLKGGLVTYFTEMKKELAHVNETTIDTYGVVSKQCALEMAKNTRQIICADYCVSFTGNAGPSTMEGKPAGRVYCAVASPNEVYTFMFQCDDMKRNDVREFVVNQMIKQTLSIIKKENE